MKKDKDAKLAKILPKYELYMKAKDEADAKKAIYEKHDNATITFKEEWVNNTLIAETKKTEYNIAQAAAVINPKSKILKEAEGYKK